MLLVASANIFSLKLTFFEKHYQSAKRFGSRLEQNLERSVSPDPDLPVISGWQVAGSRERVGNLY